MAEKGELSHKQMSALALLIAADDLENIAADEDKLNLQKVKVRDLRSENSRNLHAFKVAVFDMWRKKNWEETDQPRVSAIISFCSCTLEA